MDIGAVIDGSSIAITGGTGTLGQAVVKELTRHYHPSKIVIISRSESRQASMKQIYPEDGGPLRYRIGDVRDARRMNEALADCKLVIHAAALKRVETCEAEPEEALMTNVIGTLNVLKAARNAGAERFMFVSSDKACLDRNARVQLANGEVIAIRDLVVAQGITQVKSLGELGFESGTITGWHRNQLAGRRMLKVTVQSPLSMNHRSFGLKLTDDHLMLTPNGWRAAGQLKDGDLVVTADVTPNNRQESLLLGMMLGDSYIGEARFETKRKTPKTYLSTGHSEKQLEWLNIKYGALSEFAVRVPHRERPGTRGGERHTPFWILRFKASYYFYNLRRQFYDPMSRAKKVPRELLEKHFGPELLAAWYMDDGTYVLNGGSKETAGLRLETQGFNEDDVRWLATFLTNKGFPARAYQHVVDRHSYWQLRLLTEGATAVFNSIGRFVPPTMRYKLPSWAPAYEPHAWELGKAMPYIAPVSVKEVKPIQNEVYCIDVEPQHNFCAGGFVVHNCAPVMTYGATKYMAERLTVGMNAHRQGTSLKLSCVRYGNVLGSTGSVIHQFRAGEGPIPITDKRMTRFWWTPRDAARFVLSSLGIMRGGEIFIPKIQAMHITDMAEAIAPDRPQEIIGLRGPEKLHESMISADESRWALELKDRYVLMPALSFWPGASWPEAMPLPENWAYTSAWAAQRDPLTKERLLEMLEEV